MPKLATHFSASLQVARYKDATALLSSATTKGGKKIAKKEVANASRQVLEELGVSPRSFSVKLILAAQASADGVETRGYKDVRDTFLRALESDGPGDFLHPFYGTVQNCVAMPGWSLVENMTSVGQAELSVTFEITDPVNTRPVAVRHRVSEAILKNRSMQDAVRARLRKSYVVSTADAGNFEDAAAAQSSFVANVRAAVAKTSVLKDKLDGVSDTITKYSDKIAANLQALPAVPPLRDITDAFGEVMGALNGAYEDLEIPPGGITVPDLPQVGTDQQFVDTLKIFETFAGYVTPGEGFALTTFSRIRRQKNRDAFDQAVRTSALGYRYENAAQAEYRDVTEIDATVAKLEEEWDSLRQELPDDTRQSLADVREEALGFFADQKLTARRVKTVFTGPTSSRLLAFQYYGDSSQGEDIADLNGMADASEMQGYVQIFTTGPG